MRDAAHIINHFINKHVFLFVFVQLKPIPIAPTHLKEASMQLSGNGAVRYHREFER